jgi:reverse gyrase
METTKTYKQNCALCEKLVTKQNYTKHMKTKKCLDRRKMNKLAALAKDETISSEQFMHICVSVMKSSPLNETGFYSKAFMELLNDAVQNASK